MKKFVELNERIYINAKLLADGDYLPSAYKQGCDIYADLGELLRTQLLDELCNRWSFKARKDTCDNGRFIEYSAEVVRVSSYTMQSIDGLFKDGFITQFSVEPHGNHLLLKIIHIIK